MREIVKVICRLRVFSTITTFKNLFVFRKYKSSNIVDVELSIVDRIRHRNVFIAICYAFCNVIIQQPPRKFRVCQLF